jgi:hypothetical protein
MSALIIIDEWLFHDLLAENGDEKQNNAFLFLFKFLKKPDKIVILRGSPFEAKMFRFIKESEKDTALNVISKLFHKAIIPNSSKTLFLNREDLKPIPLKLLKLIPEDDIYLFQIHLTVKGSFILTSDGRWPTKLVQNKAVKVLMKDPFLKKYNA